jgi:hypothetical protein
MMCFSYSVGSVSFFGVSEKTMGCEIHDSITVYFNPQLPRDYLVSETRVSVLGLVLLIVGSVGLTGALDRLMD